MKRIFLNVWNGDIELWKTFWLFGVAALVLIPQILAIPAGIVGGLMHIQEGIFLVLISLLGIINIAYGVFAVIAVQRSAKRYQGSKIWARIANMTMTALVTIIIFFNVQGLYKEIKSVANQGPVRLP